NITSDRFVLSKTARITANATDTASNLEGGGSITITSSDLNLAGIVGIFAETQGITPAGTLTLQNGKDNPNLNLNLFSGSQISASTAGSGRGGNLIINAQESINITGAGELSAKTTGDGNAGNIFFKGRNLTMTDGVKVVASTSGAGNGGNIDINVAESLTMDRSNLSTATTGPGTAGRVNIHGANVTLNHAQISAIAEGLGEAGNIDIATINALKATNSTIVTASNQSSGGSITLNAQAIELRNSDIKTNVFGGAGGGGDINLTADNFILAFDDSDILAFARDGVGGDITIDAIGFFGESFQQIFDKIDPNTLDGNDRVDINASGAIDGLIVIPDVSFIQNSLSELPDYLIDPDGLIANSCIVQTDTGSKFLVTGSGGLLQRPGDGGLSYFSTENLSLEPSDRVSWQKGDPIMMGNEVFQLPNGQIFIGSRCANTNFIQ
ncbi:MAG: hypothetical protein HC796_04930, partial [Synechococcaceae cyanobacterium RL_1_2]|nr:hypothetical protein [Synechococcaceae cyanobacterium RL_1_2]